MNVVLLRNRPHFGAQITAIPALAFFSKYCCDEEPLTLFSKHDVAWVYKQLPWVKECIKPKHQMAELRQINSWTNLLNLRPSNRFPVLLYKLIKGGKIFDLVNNDFLATLTATQYNILCINEYRAITYLKIFIKDEEALLPALSAPFFELAKYSAFNITKTKLNILVMPGGGAGEIKKWGLKNFIVSGEAIGKALDSDVNIHVLLGPDETEEINTMKEVLTSSKHVFLHTDLLIKDIAKLVAICDLTIANDCGPSHIAQCMQKPYIGIYRELNPEWFLSHQKSLKVIPMHGQDIKTITTTCITEHAVHLLNESILKSQA